MKRGELVAVEKLLGPGVVGILRAGIAPALPDLIPGLLEDLLIGGVLPLHQALDDPEETLQLPFLLLFGREQIRMGGWVIHHLGKDHGSRSRQRPPGLPQMERPRMPVPDGLLPRRGLVDGIQRQGHFDEFLAVCHAAGSLLLRLCS